jgi:hypothetical protein
MKIDLSQDEFQCLLEIVNISEWIINSHNVEPDPSYSKYSDLEQKILSLAEANNLGKFVEFDKKHNIYFPTRILEEGPSRIIIDKYDEDQFWDGLFDKFVERDLIREHGIEKLQNISINRRIELEEPIREKYSKEFENNGIDNLFVKNNTNK